MMAKVIKFVICMELDIDKVRESVTDPDAGLDAAAMSDLEVLEAAKQTILASFGSEFDELEEDGGKISLLSAAVVEDGQAV